MSNTEQPYDLIYENYKEPLKRIPKSQGFGFFGTVATTKDKELIQCHFCGELFRALGRHVLAKHQMDIYEYKEKWKLSKTSALVADSVRKSMQERVVRPWDGKLPEHLREYNRKVQSGEIFHPGNKIDREGYYSLEWRNERGLCPDQVLEKIKELAEKLGHTPSEDEFREHYNGRYYTPIYTLYGSYLNAVKKAKLVSAKELKEPSNERLLQDLIDFKEKYGRIPMTSDFKRGLLRPRAMYFRRFGNLNNARIEAGLEAVIPMPFGQIVTMTADQYHKYKQGGERSKAAVRAKKWRTKKRAAIA